MNSCPTFCTSRPAPAGVAASDYQCVDFDRGVLPPVATWAPTVTARGMLSISMARAQSPAYSLQTSVTANSADVAAFTWSSVGAAPVSSVSVSAAISPTTNPLLVPPSPGGAELLCISTGFNETCLKYTVNGGVNGTTGFTGLYVDWTYTGGPAFREECTLSVTNLPINVWTTAELVVTPASGVINVTINGTSAASACTGTFGRDTIARVKVGADTQSFNNFSLVTFFDNIVATVRR